MKPDGIRVLIIDDSQLVHTLLARVFEGHEDIALAGEAFDGAGGVEMACTLAPDVIVMDINMPQMGGLEAIEEIMASHPVPIIVFSSASKNIADLGFKAIELGAVDLVEKPAARDLTELKRVIEEKLLRTIRTFADFKVIHRFKKHPPPPAFRTGPVRPEGAREGEEPSPAAARERPAVLLRERHPLPKRGGFYVIAVASSTGGPQMLHRLLGHPALASLNLGIIVLQHMAEGFLEGFIDWLKLFSALPVAVARPGDFVSPGLVQVAPAGLHLGVDRRGRFVSIEAPLVFGIRPSADVLFESLAGVFGTDLVAVVLSGMGNDGAKALAEVKKSGGYVIAQDEESSLIFGMPKAAIETGCVDRVLNIADLPEFLAKYCGQVQRRNAR